MNNKLVNENLKDLFENYQVPWFSNEGEHDDIVLASRIRLARNFEKLPFPNRASQTQLEAVQELALDLMHEGDITEAYGDDFDEIFLEDLTDLETNILIEKQFITEKLASAKKYRNVFLSKDRQCSLLINEDDHIRIICMAAGLDLFTPFEKASKIDDAIERKLDIAFDEKLGYLTSCPTNLGTGLRASVLVHLPGLVYTKNLQNIINISQQLGLSIRNFTGETTNAPLGNLFVISNQLTLGFTEKVIMENLTSAVMEIMAHERRARRALQIYSQSRLEDAVCRAYGILKYARLLELNETMEILSKVRLGYDLKIIKEISPVCLKNLIFAAQENYLKNLLHNENLSPMEVNQFRAKTLQKIVAETGRESV